MTPSDREPTICALATAAGGASAVIRLSGPRAHVIAAIAGAAVGAPWTAASSEWRLGEGSCPCRVLTASAPRTFTGCDVVEITIPGSRDLAALAVDALIFAGAQPAGPGGFTRQALANGRLTLLQAEAILAVTQAPDAEAARDALARLRGSLSRDLEQARERVLRLRALVEAGLDFLDEEDVRAYDAADLRRQCVELREVVARWLVAAGAIEGVPVLCLAGPANAGKSALFRRLTGAPALVAAIAGTTRDPLEADALIGGRQVRVVDTAGWMDASAIGQELEAAGLEAGRRAVDAATIVLGCSAPDARLPDDHRLPPARTIVVATKSDLAPADARAAVAVCSLSGDGIDALGRLLAQRLAGAASGEPRQQRLLREADSVLGRLATALPSDDLLAEDLRRLAETLGELIGATTPDDVLEAIFSRFCIGK